MMKYTRFIQKMQGGRKDFFKNPPDFLCFPRRPPEQLSGRTGSSGQLQVYIFKIFILTIAQPSDGINPFLQLFLHKLRTRPFIRSVSFVCICFCAVLTIRYYLNGLCHFSLLKSVFFAGFCGCPSRTIVSYTNFGGFCPCSQMHPQRLHLQLLLPFPAFCRFSKTVLHSFYRMR